MANQAITNSIAGKGEKAGDVTIVNNGDPCQIILKCSNGTIANYGWYGNGDARYYTKFGLEKMSSKEIWVTAEGKTLCKGLTNYRIDYKPIVFQINPQAGICDLNK